MSERSERYEVAAKAYELPYGDFKRERETITSFIEGPEWVPALKLLKASGRNISIGQIPSSETEYFLGGEGFFAVKGKGRKVIRDEKGSVSDVQSATSEKILLIATAFRVKFKEKSLLFTDFIYGELDGVADTCPK